MNALDGCLQAPILAAIKAQDIAFLGDRIPTTGLAAGRTLL